MAPAIRFVGLALGLTLSANAYCVDVEKYVRQDDFDGMKLSPDGAYFAATVPLEDRTVLVTIRRADRKVLGTFRLAKNSHVDEFWWVAPDRLLLTVAEKYGSLDEPLGTGELFTMMADGSGAEILVGARVDGMTTGSRLRSKQAESLAAWLLDDLKEDDDGVLVSVRPFTQDAYAQVDRLDVRSGKRTRVVRAPIPNASFFTDNRGEVRFALGLGRDNVRKLFRLRDGDQWDVVATDDAGRMQWPVGFSSDNRTVFLEVEQPSGPNRLVAWNLDDGSRREVLADDDVDPYIIVRNGDGVPVGAMFMDGKPRTSFFDNGSPEARQQRALERAFAGHAVHVTSRTRDGRTLLLNVWSDRNPGDFYLYDTVARKAELVQSRAHWFDPEATAAVEPVRIRARDGRTLHGYLTRPADRPGRLPMVVLPHGGPYGVRDVWGFDGEAQLLADAGYAVLQMNFRGSGGYGREFQVLGARQWGGTMQDDLTDATRWAVDEGHADRSRICIYGASYGAYAALMGAAREPGLYRCAVGYVGVYDLPLMQSEDSRVSRRLSNWSKEWVGDDRTALALASPARSADRIGIPVFLAAGGEDERAPIRHSRIMEAALRKAGTPVETLYYDTEGHGFYRPEHRREFYTRLLAFLSRSLGGATASVAPSGTPAAAK